METPKDAKRAGSKAGLNGRKIQLRDDWKVVKRPVMHLGLVLKFTNNYELAKSLVATGSKLLVEGNCWHDNYWGNCYCNKCEGRVGENNLGLLLMSVRQSLFITIMRGNVYVV